MIRLFNADSLVVMNTMPDKAYDLAVVDPPYGIGDIRDGGHDDNRPINKYKEVVWNNSIPSEEYFRELHRVSKNRIIFGCQYYAKYLTGEDVGRIIHDKIIPMSTISQADIASCSFHNRVRMFRYKWHGFIRESGCEYNNQRIHPCEKPVRLYEWLLKNYAKPGDKILDTHGGSGSICIACHDLGYSLDWYEIDAEYFQAAKERLERHQRQEMLPLEIPPQPIQGVL